MYSRDGEKISDYHDGYVFINATETFECEDGSTATMRITYGYGRFGKFAARTTIYFK